MGLSWGCDVQDGPGGSGSAGECARGGSNSVVVAQQTHRGVLLRVDGGGVVMMRECERRKEDTLLTQEGE